MALVFEVKVIPNSSKKSITIDPAGRVTCHVTSVPEKGRANKEVLALFAKKLGIAQASVSILAGQTGRKKYIKLSLDITYEQLLHRLGLDQQLPML